MITIFWGHSVFSPIKNWFKIAIINKIGLIFETQETQGELKQFFKS
jgi:hypothetical protein